MQENKKRLSELRKENKTIAAKLKGLKKPAVATRATNPSDLMKEKIKTTVSLRNKLRHEAQQKQKKIDKMNETLRELELENDAKEKKPTSASASSDTQRLRTLENNLDKANIKCQEAEHISKTYQQIIQKLEQDRLQFDGVIDDMEKSLALRKQELAQLESMCTDSFLARDKAREALAAKEAEFADARVARENEKQQLSALTEERRRQFEAVERRMRLASAGVKDDSEGIEMMIAFCFG